MLNGRGSNSLILKATDNACWNSRERSARLTTQMRALLGMLTLSTGTLQDLKFDPDYQVGWFYSHKTEIIATVSDLIWVKIP